MCMWIAVLVLAAPVERPVEEQQAGAAVDVPLPEAVQGGVGAREMWGEPAAEMQRALARLGYQPGPVDGVVGPRTTAALRQFQACNGIRAHGRLDFSTRSLLHLRPEELFAQDQPPEIARVWQGVEPPAVADPADVAGSDPLDLSSMPTAGDANEPIDAREIAPVAGRDADWMAATTRDQCVERRRKP